MKVSALLVALALTPTALAGSDSSISTLFGVDVKGATSGTATLESALSDDVGIGIVYKHGDKQSVKEVYLNVKNQATPFGTTTDTSVSVDPADNGMEGTVKVAKDDVWAKFDLKSAREPVLEGVELSAPLTVGDTEITLQPYVSMPSLGGHLKAKATVADTDLAVKVYKDNGPVEVGIKRKISDDTTIKIDAVPSDKSGEVEVEHKVGKHTLYAKARRAAGESLKWVNSGLKTTIGDNDADITVDPEELKVKTNTNIAGQSWITTVRTPWGSPKKTSVTFGRDFEF